MHFGPTDRMEMQGIVQHEIPMLAMAALEVPPFECCKLEENDHKMTPESAMNGWQP